jgi:hypothetical protein
MWNLMEMEHHSHSFFINSIKYYQEVHECNLKYFKIKNKKVQIILETNANAWKIENNWF